MPEKQESHQASHQFLTFETKKVPKPPLACSSALLALAAVEGGEQDG